MTIHKKYKIKSVYYTTILIPFLLCATTSRADFLPARAVDTAEIPQIRLAARDTASKPLPFYKISHNTYFLYANIAEIDADNRGFNGNAGFVVTTEGVVVIDSLGTPKLGKRLIATIRKVTRQPIKFLILTHNHPDHSYGAIAFKNIPGIQVIGHAGTLDYLNSDNLQGSVAYRQNLVAADMQGFQGVKPDILIGGERYTDYQLKLGGITFAIYNTGQHHSFGDLIVHQVEDRQLWISDLAFNNRSTYMGDGHSAEILQTVDWMKQKFPDIHLMIPGHGSAQTPPFPMVDKTYQYVQRLRNEMKTAIDSGQDLATAVRQSDFADWHDMPLYEENHKKNANFVYLEQEQDSFFGK